MSGPRRLAAEALLPEDARPRGSLAGEPGT